MTDERIVALDLVRHSGLNAIAQECHRLAVARGKYPDGLTAFLGRKDWLSKSFCSFRCLEEWAKREQRRDRRE